MSAFSDYLAELRKNLALGDATEHTHRLALQTLLQSVRDGITATNEPKHIPLVGAPDFKVSRGKIPLGHIETKDIGTNLAEMEHGKGPHAEQFSRYSALPNWILTDYLEFRWYTHGERRRVVRIAELAGNKIKPLPDGEQQITDLLDSFIRCPALTVGTAAELADSMAGYARTLQHQTVAALQQEPDTGWLHQWLSAFRETLIPDLDDKQFADMFAQTLAYGLFAARVHTPDREDFKRDSAARAIPKTNPFLQQLFYEITGPKLPDSIGWVMDSIVELLNHANMHDILKDFGKGKGKEDPVVHFYETFLAAYDPKMREVRGVYYTPEPVVSYIVRSIDHLLKTKFDRPKGLADENTLILDPATGTATFLYFVIDQIYQKFAGQKGAWDGYVDKHLLNRIFGFELLIAPYAIAHLKLGMQLHDLGYTFRSDQRLGIYLTNTLEEAAKKSEKLFAQWISDEANAAAEIKRDKKIMVVLGNPPYSGHSANRSIDEKGELTFIGKLLTDYKYVDGQPLGERNSKWLQDDYVKFIRFAEWRIERTKFGIIGFVTNHAYLDNPTFRGMRQDLLNTFDEIYVYDLHGNSKKGETTPSGGKDENVFSIQQGVAILFCVKQDRPGCRAKVYHADLWGYRDRKYSTLNEADISKTKWKEILPISPTYLFIPHDIRRIDEYQQGKKVTDIFPVNNMGITTGNDDCFVAFTYNELASRFENDLRDIRVAYRPFDERLLQYAPESLARARADFMQQIAGGENRVLLTLRRPRSELVGNFFVSRGYTDKCAISSLDNAQLFPLYIYQVEKRKRGDWSKALTMALFEPQVGYSARRPNLGPYFLSELAEKLKLPQTEPHGLPKGTTPEDIFHYAYAVFHSPTYRTRYAEFLKIDFPRLPLTGDLKLFRALAAKGAELVELHLMESKRLNNLITTFPLKGSDEVEKVQFVVEGAAPSAPSSDQGRDGARPSKAAGRVYINPKQYFGGVSKAVWEFHIGGYQVCEKWLKDRKGRKLTYDDIQHYQKIVVALSETIRLMAEIDGLISRWPLT